MDKPLVWLAGEVKTPPFSPEARVEAGFLLRQLQRGLTLRMPFSRPLPDVGVRCHELRVRDRKSNWRIVYRADDDAVILLEVFAKKTARLPKAVIRACRERLTGYDRATEETQ